MTRLRPYSPEPFGRFTLLAPLAAGGMGEIFLARATFQGGLERLCAIKKVLPEYAAQAELVGRFLDEARVLAQLQHGCIAQVYDAGIEGDEPWIALEFVDGKDLRRAASRVRERGERFPIELALGIAVRVLEALGYAHRRRDDSGAELELVHRDVSPANVLLSYEGEVKVIDFGLAKTQLARGRTQRSVILGKLCYMAPEQARSQPLDGRTDLYALGLVLYELLAGENPFEGRSASEVLDGVAHPQLASLRQVAPHVPGSVTAVVDRALQIAPADRFQTAEEMRAALTACLRGLTSDVGPVQLGAFVRELFAEEYEAERLVLRGRDEELRASTSGGTARFDRSAGARGWSAAGELLGSDTATDLARVREDGAAQETFAANPGTDAHDPNAAAGGSASVIAPEHSGGTQRSNAEVLEASEPSAHSSEDGADAALRASSEADTDRAGYRAQRPRVAAPPWDPYASGGHALIAAADASLDRNSGRHVPWESERIVMAPAAVPDHPTTVAPIEAGDPAPAPFEAGSFEVARELRAPPLGWVARAAIALAVSGVLAYVLLGDSAPTRRGATPIDARMEARARTSAPAPVAPAPIVEAAELAVPAEADELLAQPHEEADEPAPPERRSAAALRQADLAALPTPAAPTASTSKPEQEELPAAAREEESRHAAPRGRAAAVELVPAKGLMQPMPRGTSGAPAATPALAHTRPAPAQDAAATPSSGRVERLAERYRAATHAFDELVAAHGEGRLGGLVVALKRSVDSTYERLLESPDRHAELDQQLSDLERALAERTRALR